MKQVGFQLLVCILLSPFLTKAQPGFAIPDKIVGLLDSAYHGWHLVDNLEVINEPVLQYLHLDTTKCRPNFVWGDFNGDGKTDYVAYIERKLNPNPREQFLLAFVSEDNEFRPFVLGKSVGDGYLGDYIWLMNKGDTSYVFYKDEEFVLKNDAIERYFIEKASTLFYFENGEWKRIMTSD
jgi:hypothetical protein